MPRRRAIDDRVVHPRARGHRAERRGRVVGALGHGQQVGRHAEVLRGERRAEPPQARDHLVEDEQDAVAVADLAQSLQIALRRDQHAGRARHRLDDHRGNGRCVMQRD